MTDRRDISAPGAPRAVRGAVAALALVAAAGCGVAETTPSGLCDISYDDALFTVTRATDARSGAALSRVLLRSYTYEGSSERGPGFLVTAPGLQPRNSAVNGTGLTCDIVCSFGAANGDYTLTFGAAGYRDTTLQIAGASHAVQQGGCPATYRDGLELEVTLTPN
jgi:hypothetical protein